VTHPILAGAVPLPLRAGLKAGLTAALTAAVTAPVAAAAGPVLCNTTLEAPLGSSAPVEVTRCGVVQTVPALVHRRYFSYRSPFARGVDLTHQITDFFGIAMGGGDGTKVMGLGFPDQAIVWDGSAVENTMNVLLEEQSDPLPLRTADLPSCFNTSLAGTPCTPGGTSLAPAGRDPSSYDSQETYPSPGSGGWSDSRRGLW
jgi:hypothetical protein